jgi:KDO2-lipid IV(A) lauroyltransferase
MWLVPHFMALDVAGAATQLFQKPQGRTIYQAQSNAVFDAAMRRGRLRFGQRRGLLAPRQRLPLVRAIKRGMASSTCPTWTSAARCGLRALLRRAGVHLLAPSRMARALKHGGAAGGGRDAARRPGLPGALRRPWTDWPTDDPEADAATHERVDREPRSAAPAQYLWVHKRFKTRPEGEASLYLMPDRER